MIFETLFQKVDVLCGINIKKVACGTQFSVALTKDGRVFTFGQGRPHSIPVRTLTFQFNSSVTCIYLFIFFFLGPDRLIGLPEGRARNHNRPQQVPALAGIHIQDVAVGAEHTLVLSSTGDVYAWGSNSEGQVPADQELHRFTSSVAVSDIRCLIDRSF